MKFSTVASTLLLSGSVIATPIISGGVPTVTTVYGTSVNQHIDQLGEKSENGADGTGPVDVIGVDYNPRNGGDNSKEGVDLKPGEIGVNTKNGCKFIQRESGSPSVKCDKVVDDPGVPDKVIGTDDGKGENTAFNTGGDVVGGVKEPNGTSGKEDGANKDEVKVPDGTYGNTKVKNGNGCQVTKNKGGILNVHCDKEATGGNGVDVDGTTGEVRITDKNGCQVIKKDGTITKC